MPFIKVNQINRLKRHKHNSKITVEQITRNIAEAILSVHGINQYSNSLVSFFGHGHETNNRQAIINWVKITRKDFELDPHESVSTYIDLYRDRINEIMDLYN